MKSCCKLCGEENCGFVSRNLEYKCDKYNLYCATVDKACEWLRTNYEDIGIRYIRGHKVEDEIESFKKAMEE